MHLTSIVNLCCNVFTRKQCIFQMLTISKIRAVQIDKAVSTRVKIIKRGQLEKYMKNDLERVRFSNIIADHTGHISLDMFNNLGAYDMMPENCVIDQYI